MLYAYIYVTTVVSDVITAIYKICKGLSRLVNPWVADDG